MRATTTDGDFMCSYGARRGGTRGPGRPGEPAEYYKLAVTSRSSNAVEPSSTRRWKTPAHFTRDASTEFQLETGTVWATVGVLCPRCVV